ncbi:MAG: hypothetical protein ACK47B_11095 [Armatimonadota bacterium]
MDRRHCLHLAAAAAGLAALNAEARAEDELPLPLGEAVEAFNRRAAADPVGRTQPPLTEDEVVAAIRGWMRERVEVTDNVFARFQRVAETGRLPEGAEFRFITGWGGFRGFDFEVWWVDLVLRTGPDKVFAYRIRDQKLRSRPSPPPAEPDPRFPIRLPRAVLKP